MVVISLALSLLSASIGAAGADESTGDLASLVEAHLNWLGGRAAMSRLQDLTWTGTFSAAGFEGREVLRETRDGRSHQETASSQFSQVQRVAFRPSTDYGPSPIVGY
jgi:hypothetical protein